MHTHVLFVSTMGIVDFGISMFPSPSTQIFRRNSFVRDILRLLLATFSPVCDWICDNVWSFFRRLVFFASTWIFRAPGNFDASQWPHIWVRCPLQLRDLTRFWYFMTLSAIRIQLLCFSVFGSSFYILVVLIILSRTEREASILYEVKKRRS